MVVRNGGARWAKWGLSRVGGGAVGAPWTDGRRARWEWSVAELRMWWPGGCEPTYVVAAAVPGRRLCIYDREREY
jgi:hypothetical protein